jgi:hypothetical protein
MESVVNLDGYHHICAARVKIWLIVLTLISSTSCVSAAEKTSPLITFQNEIELGSFKEKSSNVSAGDLNGDGHLDVLLAKGRHWPLSNSIFIGDGNGGFSEPEKLDDTPDRSYSAVLFDLDGDRDLDVVVSNDRPDPTKVYFNDGSGQFSAVGVLGKEKWPTRNIYVGYIDSDKYPDVLIANRSKKGSSTYVCYGEAGGLFEKKCNSIARGPATTSISVDLDKDGCKDIIVPHRDQGQSYAYLCTGNRVFDKKIAFGDTSMAIRSVVAGDFDGDGNIDISIIDDSRGPAVLWGADKQLFSSPQWLESEIEKPNALAQFDINDDGLIDIVVGYRKAQPKVFFNRGGKQFTSVPFGDDEGVVYGFAFGDFNEDSVIDIAVARSGATDVVYLGEHK